MQIIKATFYILFIIQGGFRHFGFEYSFYSDIYLNNYDPNIYSSITLIETTLYILAILALIFNKIKWMDLLIFILLFILDIYFQNFVKFESSIILVHFTPLLFFLSYQLKEKKKTAYVALLFLSVGFSSSGLLKILSGWLSLNDIVIYSYIVEFNNGYELPSLLGNSLINMELPFYFWKICDYMVVIFQMSYLLLFFNIKWFKFLLPLSAIFHILILLTLGITVFYPYMIVYLLILVLMNENSSINNKLSSIIQGIISTAGIFFLGTIIYFKFDCHFFYRYSSSFFYFHLDYLYNIILAILVLAFTFFHLSKKDTIS